MTRQARYKARSSTSTHYRQFRLCLAPLCMTLSDCVLELDSYPNCQHETRARAAWLPMRSRALFLPQRYALVRSSQSPGRGRAGKVARSPVGPDTGRRAPPRAVPLPGGGVSRLRCPVMRLYFYSVRFRIDNCYLCRLAYLAARHILHPLGSRLVLRHQPRFVRPIMPAANAHTQHAD